MRIPVDSAEAAEIREAEEANPPAPPVPRPSPDPAAQPPDPPHDSSCVGGWLGEDDQGRPRPCLVCRPHLAHPGPCRNCGVATATCSASIEAGCGRCCDSHDHPLKG